MGDKGKGVPVHGVIQQQVAPGPQQGGEHQRQPNQHPFPAAPQGKPQGTDQGPLPGEKLHQRRRNDQHAGHPGEGRTHPKQGEPPPLPLAGVPAGPRGEEQEQALGHHGAEEEGKGEQAQVQQAVPDGLFVVILLPQPIEIAAGPCKAQAGQGDPSPQCVGDHQPQQPHCPHIAREKHQEQVLPVFLVTLVSLFHQVPVVVAVPSLAQLAEALLPGNSSLREEHDGDHPGGQQGHTRPQSSQKHPPKGQSPAAGQRLFLRGINQAGMPAGKAPGFQAPQDQRQA